jgi:hypothetical protein
MHLLKAIKDSPIRRVTRLALPRITTLQDACSHFEGTRAPPEDTDERLNGILASFKKEEAAKLDRRDIRFIMAAVGSSKRIGQHELVEILAEIERRKDNRLVHAAFRALLAGYRHEHFRLPLRAFVVRHANLLPSHTHHFCKQSEILRDDEHLRVLGKNLVQSKDSPLHVSHY